MSRNYDRERTWQLGAVRKGKGCCRTAIPVCASVRRLRGRQPILRSAVRAHGPGPEHLGMGGGAAQVGQDRVALDLTLGEGSGFVFKRKATESCSADYSSFY